MDYFLNFLKHNKIRIIDHTNSTTIDHIVHSPTTSFAIDDALAISVGSSISPITLRLWQHNKSVILGIPDSSLPFFKDGISHIYRQGFHPIIRNSGGLAVVLDDGVLNLSIILPNAKKVSINDGYTLMYSLIKKLFRTYTTDIMAYEIVGSYCPGDFDLSINGKKFAGISQRRVRNGVAIQIYIDISGDSQKKAFLMKEFYDISKKDVDTSFQYPNINVDVMASLNELLALNLSVEDVIRKLKLLVNKYSHVVQGSCLNDIEKKYLVTRLKQMNNRNKKLQLILHEQQ